MAADTPLRRLLPDPGPTTLGEQLAGFDPVAAAGADRPYLFTPLGHERKFVRGAELEGLPEEIAAVSRDARIAAVARVDA